MDWEVFYTTLADGSTTYYTDNYQNIYPTNYNSYAMGIDLNWHFKNGNFKLGYLRALNDSVSTDDYYATGGVQATYLPSLYTNGTATMLGWVNPNGYFANQLAANHPVGWNNMSPIVTGGDDSVADVFGPQGTTNWSASLHYAVEDSKMHPRFFIEYASSNYKPNMNSDYSKTGSALRAGIGLTFLNDALDLDIGYKSIDAYYDPFTLSYPVGVNALWSIPTFSYYPNMYQLHDSDIYTNNREGWTFKLTYRFKDDKGKIWVSYDALQQKDSSQYNVIYPMTDSVAPGVPNNMVFGYEPGFIDTIFTPYDVNTYSYYSPGVSVDDNKGKANRFDVGLDLNFKNNFSLDASYYNQTYKRDTNLEIGQIVSVGNEVWNTGVSASTDYIDLKFNGFHIGLGYAFNERLKGNLGFDYTSIKGHYDPSGVYSNYAWNTGSHDFTNIDVNQTSPSIGFDYKLSKNTEWGMNFKYYNTKDNVDGLLDPAPSVGDTVANPFSWKGTQLTTEFKVKF
jgi:hypothetical protein